MLNVLNRYATNVDKMITRQTQVFDLVRTMITTMSNLIDFFDDNVIIKQILISNLYNCFSNETINLHWT